MTTARTRVDASSCPTVYVDASNGNDSNDGTSAHPLQTLQCAFNFASGNFDLAPPFSWTAAPGTYVGERTGVTIQMANAPASAPYILTNPLWVDGLGSSGPIMLRGDPATPTNVFIRADAANYQGITAQRGARVLCDGFAITGAANCTLLNALTLGTIGIKNVWFGPPTTGSNAPVGAAGGGQIDVLGKLSFWGSGFIAMFSAIEGARIILTPAAEIYLSNAMNFGIMLNVMQAAVWTQGALPTFSGAFSGSSGSKYNAYYHAFIGISNTDSNVPGSAGNKDSTSIVL